MLHGADPSTPNQTVCSGTPLTDIEFRIGGGARDVNLSGSLFTSGGYTRANNVVLNDPSNPQILLFMEQHQLLLVQPHLLTKLPQ